MSELKFNTIRPATDLLLMQIRETLGEIQAHEHPKGTGDFYCLNLTSWLGERMGPVLRRLADEQAETRKWQSKHSALADEFASEAERLQAEVDRERGKVGDLVREVNRLTDENKRLRDFVDADIAFRKSRLGDSTDITRGQGEVWPAGASLPAGPPLPRRVPMQAAFEVGEFPPIVQPAPMTDPALEDRTEGEQP